jgi:hypothetical protein
MTQALLIIKVTIKAAVKAVSVSIKVTVNVTVKLTVRNTWKMTMKVKLNVTVRLMLQITFDLYYLAYGIGKITCNSGQKALLLNILEFFHSDGTVLYFTCGITTSII